MRGQPKSQGQLGRLAVTDMPALSRRDALKAGAAGMMGLLTLGHTSPAITDELLRLAGEHPMTGAKLAGILRAEREKWSALPARVGKERMEVAGAEGAWSVKEIVAHLTWYERAVVEGAQQVLRVGRFEREDFQKRSGLAGLTIDQRNERIAAEAHGRALDDVLAEADQTFAELMTLIAAASDDVLNDPLRLGLAEDVTPWMLVANNSYGHYRQHEQAIRAWLERV